MEKKAQANGSNTRLPEAKAGGGKVASRSSASELAAFIRSARKLDPQTAGRLIFSLDATMSRQPTWDRACQIQASMFDAVGKVGGLAVQLVYFRGFGECRASKWVMDSTALRNLMTGIDCRGGQTQIAKTLKHAIKETGRERVAAMVFIGDAMEEEIDRLCHLAGELGMKGTRLFLFQEGGDRLTEQAFKQMAKLSNGVYFRLGSNSAKDLAELLGAIAVYASGGVRALEKHGGAGGRKLLAQLPAGAKRK